MAPLITIRPIKTSLIKLRTTLQKYRRNHFTLFCLCWGAIFLFFVGAFTDLPSAISAYSDQGAEDNIRMYKDLYSYEPWPQVGSTFLPPEIPTSVHYFWCGYKMFRFEDYLGLVSVVRVLRPQKLIFHYHQLPYIDLNWYNTWFQELKQSIPNLVLRYTSGTPKCGSRGVVEFALRQLASSGGFFIGERTLLTHIPQEAWSDDFYFNFRINEVSHDLTQGVIFSKAPFNEDLIEDKLNQIFESNTKCYTVPEFNSLPSFQAPSTSSSSSSSSSNPEQPCLVLTESLYPKDIWNSTSRFAELSRWLYYGKRRRLEVKQSENDKELIPLVTNLVWMKTDNILKSNEFKFLHYLSVMSALYVAGFERVYVHGEMTPFGTWWDRLEGENVTFIKIEPPETIFQQSVAGPAHQSDVLRLSTLLKYGGAYQDRDVIWVSKIPDWLRRYPAVACPDWPINGEWPESFNMGVMMAKPNADWLRYFLKTFRFYRDDKWAFNAVMMPYKAYEQHPDTLYVDRHLQVICFKGVCHPVWHTDYKRSIYDERPIINFNWREARAFHFTVPKPPTELRSPEGVRNGMGMFAEMGRMILEKSGQSDLLN